METRAREAEVVAVRRGKRGRRASEGPNDKLQLRRSKEALCMEMIILIDVFLVLADGVSAA